MLPIKEHETEILETEGHEIELKTSPDFSLEISMDYQFSFNYCVAFRDPNLPEWILARGYWNDEGLWTPDGLWYDQ